VTALYGEDVWLRDVLAYYNAHGIHWTYWTWKAVKNYMFPDGIYSYVPNDPWVNRPGPLYGWETWHLHWKDKKEGHDRIVEDRGVHTEQGDCRRVAQGVIA